MLKLSLNKLKLVAKLEALKATKVQEKGNCFDNARIKKKREHFNKFRNRFLK